MGSTSSQWNKIATENCASCSKRDELWFLTENAESFCQPVISSNCNKMKENALKNVKKKLFESPTFTLT